MLELRCGAMSAIVAPERGAAVLGWLRDATPILRRATATALFGAAGAMGAFPLVPYCNRIAFGRFRWNARDYTLDRNFGDHPHTLHGIGWKRAWAVETAEPAFAELSLEHDPLTAGSGGWPFAFRAVARYRMTPDALHVGLSVTSRHAEPVPAGIGFHPYFPRHVFTALRFAATGVWRNDSTALPVSHETVPAAWDHAAGRPVGSVVLDNCFTGWDGRADVAGTGLGTGLSLSLTADTAFRNLQVFTPPGATAFAAEPVSHAPDAINRPGLPPGQAMHVLAPGETLAGNLVFSLTDGAS
jgi:aldose 1-epimerase